MSNGTTRLALMRQGHASEASGVDTSRESWKPVDLATAEVTTGSHDALLAALIEEALRARSERDDLLRVIEKLTQVVMGLVDFSGPPKPGKDATPCKARRLTLLPGALELAG